jgi:hypothetical protein
VVLQGKSALQSQSFIDSVFTFRSVPIIQSQTKPSQHTSTRAARRAYSRRTEVE